MPPSVGPVTIAVFPERFVVGAMKEGCCSMQPRTRNILDRFEEMKMELLVDGLWAYLLHSYSLGMGMCSPQRSNSVACRAKKVREFVQKKLFSDSLLLVIFFLSMSNVANLKYCKNLLDQRIPHIYILITFLVFGMFRRLDQSAAFRHRSRLYWLV